MYFLLLWCWFGLSCLFFVIVLMFLLFVICCFFIFGIMCFGLSVWFSVQVVVRCRWWSVVISWIVLWLFFIIVVFIVSCLKGSVFVIWSFVFQIGLQGIGCFVVVVVMQVCVVVWLCVSVVFLLWRRRCWMIVYVCSCVYLYWRFVMVLFVFLEWVVFDWFECIFSCGLGFCYCVVFCKSVDYCVMLFLVYCLFVVKLLVIMCCNLCCCFLVCWVVGEWGECFVQCGVGQWQCLVCCISYMGQVLYECMEVLWLFIMQQCEVKCDSLIFGDGFEECKDVNKVVYCFLVFKFQFCS